MSYVDANVARLGLHDETLGPVLCSAIARAMIGDLVDVADDVHGGVTFERLACFGLLSLTECALQAGKHHVIIPWVLLSWVHSHPSVWLPKPRAPPAVRGVPEMAQNIEWLLRHEQPVMFLRHSESWSALERFGVAAFAMMMNSYVILGHENVPLKTFHRGMVIMPPVTKVARELVEGDCKAEDAEPLDPVITVAPVRVDEVVEQISPDLSTYHRARNHREIHMPNPSVALLNGTNGKALDAVHVSVNGIAHGAQMKDFDEKVSSGNRYVAAAVRQLNTKWGTPVVLLLSRTSSWALSDVTARDSAVAKSTAVTADASALPVGASASPAEIADDDSGDIPSVLSVSVQPRVCPHCPATVLLSKPARLDSVAAPTVALDWRTMSSYWPGLHLHPLINPAYPINHPLVTRQSLAQRVSAAKLTGECRTVTVNVHILAAVILAERQAGGEFASAVDLQRRVANKAVTMWWDALDAAVQKMVSEGRNSIQRTPARISLDRSVVFWRFCDKPAA
jgi:hypothetical protein